MLVETQPEVGQYKIAITHATGWTELAADFLALEGVPHGELLFDFTHLSGNLTRVDPERLEHLPASFGFHPTDRLTEEIACIGYFQREGLLQGHTLKAKLPRPQTKVGAFLATMKVSQMLQKMSIEVDDAASVTEEGEDDTSRQNLIPLSYVGFEDGKPDFKMISRLRRQIEAALTLALEDDQDLANKSTSVVNEALDNMVDYSRGGLVAGLYYPRIGEVEISLINRHEGFGGDTPQEQLDRLLNVIEGATERTEGGGNGISELMDLTHRCLGTLRLSNGNASLYVAADGSMATSLDDTGIMIPGGRVTILLQLLPAAPMPTATARAMVELVRKTIFQNLN